MIKETYEYSCDICKKKIQKKSDFKSIGVTPIIHTPHSTNMSHGISTIDYCPDCFEKMIRPLLFMAGIETGDYI